VKLEGTISTFPLRELIDMIAYSSVTGVLNIYAADLSGHLYFRDGHLYHVAAGTAEGIDALALILERPQATFAFVSDPTVDRETLWGDYEQHLRLAEHLAARWSHIRPHIPHLKLIPILLAPIEQVQRAVNPAHLPLLDMIDGERTLIAITRSLGWTPIEVAEATLHLLQQRLIALHQGPASERPPVEERPDAAYPSRSGIFDRMRRQAGGASRSESVAPAPAAPDDFVLRILRS
jgi:hypothetical protein